ncbi:MAG: 16S rRNA (guanine(527)-N(7))-methyltransferase RsmG [Spirochaetaceae bacterium]|jgi:16S rRNA (guanine527-N7)-methyltransferase|nr:16S rRNA (guanine(527)-N(7))-methyltransferase RsmG [Spirochaetaceae bacterium]
MNELEIGVQKIYSSCNGNAAFLRGADECIELLNKYINEIEMFNGAYGLVSYASRTELVIKHILDSLAPLPYLQKKAVNAVKDDAVNAADIGSGAGLPGIPLAIALPHWRWTLIERGGRRYGFLLNTIAALGLSNACAVNADLHETKTGGFNLAVCRAFKPLDVKLCKGIKRILAPGGILAMYKGRRENIEREMSALPGTRYEVHSCSVPFLDEERHIAGILA